MSKIPDVTTVESDQARVDAYVKALEYKYPRIDGNELVVIRANNLREKILRNMIAKEKESLRLADELHGNDDDVLAKRVKGNNINKILREIEGLKIENTSIKLLLEFKRVRAKNDHSRHSPPIPRGDGDEITESSVDEDDDASRLVTKGGELTPYAKRDVSVSSSPVAGREQGGTDDSRQGILHLEEAGDFECSVEKKEEVKEEEDEKKEMTDCTPISLPSDRAQIQKRSDSTPASPSHSESPARRSPTRGGFLKMQLSRLLSGGGGEVQDNHFDFSQFGDDLDSDDDMVTADVLYCTNTDILTSLDVLSPPPAAMVIAPPTLLASSVRQGTNHSIVGREERACPDVEQHKALVPGFAPQVSQQGERVEEGAAELQQEEKRRVEKERLRKEALVLASTAAFASAKEQKRRAALSRKELVVEAVQSLKKKSEAFKRNTLLERQRAESYRELEFVRKQAEVDLAKEQVSREVNRIKSNEEEVGLTGTSSVSNSFIANLECTDHKSVNVSYAYQHYDDLEVSAQVAESAPKRRRGTHDIDDDLIRPRDCPFDFPLFARVCPVLSFMPSPAGVPCGARCDVEVVVQYPVLDMEGSRLKNEMTHSAGLFSPTDDDSQSTFFNPDYFRDGDSFSAVSDFRKFDEKSCDVKGELSFSASDIVDEYPCGGGGHYRGPGVQEGPGLEDLGAMEDGIYSDNDDSSYNSDEYDNVFNEELGASISVVSNLTFDTAIHQSDILSSGDEQQRRFSLVLDSPGKDRLSQSHDLETKPSDMSLRSLGDNRHRHRSSGRSRDGAGSYTCDLGVDGCSLPTGGSSILQSNPSLLNAYSENDRIFRKQNRLNMRAVRNVHENIFDQLEDSVTSKEEVNVSADKIMKNNFMDSNKWIRCTACRKIPLNYSGMPSQIPGITSVESYYGSDSDVLLEQEEEIGCFSPDVLPNWDLTDL